MKSFQVIRSHLSPYQSADFIGQEKAALEALPNISYREMNQVSTVEETILITNTHTQLKSLPEDLLKRTKLIVHPNSGYDHFALEKNLWENIPILLGNTIRAQAVAEYNLACLFEWASDLPQHLVWNKERSWQRRLINEMNIWVFGYGHIGKKVADTLASLGAKITVVDPYIKNCPHQHLSSWKEGSLTKAHAVLMCTSLNSTSQHLLNEDFFHHASSELVIINGARGKLIDEKALKYFLNLHPKAFAFLDVFENEPFSEEWHHYPQVWKTSHIAGVSKTLDQKILGFEKVVIEDFISLNSEQFLLKYKNVLLQNKWIQGVLV